MRWIIPMLCFFGGAMFGMLTTDHGPDGGKQPGRKKRGGDDGCRRKSKAGQ